MKTAAQEAVQPLEELVRQSGVLQVFEASWAVLFTRHDQMIDARTTGLKEHFGHDELQIVLGMSVEEAHEILSQAVRLIKKGAHFEAGMEYGIASHLIRMVKSPERDATLRLIFPDEDGWFANPDFSWQEAAIPGLTAN